MPLCTRKLDSEQALYDAALRALMRRAHSVCEMRIYLERRAQDETLVRAVLARLKQAGYLDDARFAREFTGSRANSRRQGRFRIARELRARGVPDRHIEAAAEQVFDEIDEAALVRQRIQRRLRSLAGKKPARPGPLRGRPPRPGDAERKKIASLYRSLLAAGFPADLIRRELKSVVIPDVDLSADPPEPEDL